MDDHALVLPAWVYLKLCAINAGWVFIGHGGRWVGKWHLHIGVMGAHCHAVERRVQQLHRPIARHREGDPRRIRVAKPGGQFRAAHQLKIPFAVKRLDPRRG